MVSIKRIRIFEGTLVALFLLQAFRLFFSRVLPSVQASVPAFSLTSPVSIAFAFLLLGLTLISVFAHKAQSPQVITLSVIIIAVARFSMTLGDPILALFSSVVLIVSALVYFIHIIRINRFIWVTTIVLSMAFDLLFRVSDTLDISMRPWLEVGIGDFLYRIPFFFIQATLTGILIGVALYLRNKVSQEEYAPGRLALWSGLAFGGFLSLQFIVLFLPNVIARWTAMPYESIAPWNAFALLIPMIPAVRHAFGALVSHLEGSLKGWLIFFILVVLLIVGYRIQGVVASSGLIICSFTSTMLLWWIPEPGSQDTEITTGWSLSIGVIVFLFSIFLYAQTIDSNTTPSILRGQSLVIIIFEAILCCLPLVIYAEDNPWLEKFSTQENGVPISLLIVITGLSIMLISPQFEEKSADPFPIRVATYNVNYGFNELGEFDFEQIALAIKASDADVIALQEVDTGHPASFGMDQVQYLARHMNMLPVFQPDSNKLQGLAILSRYYPANSRGSSIVIDDESALMLVVNILVSDFDKPIQILTGEMLNATQTDRLAQFALLYDLIDGDEPVILAADLAGSTGDILYQQLIQTGFVDPDMILGIEQNYTYPATNPSTRTDMILLKGFFPVSSYQVDSNASDHRLVLVLASPD